ncbi:MAG: hypothetical protein U1F43_17135 [Myxococcota bacterium]
MKFHRPLAAALALSALAACPSASAPRPARPTPPASARGGFVVVTLANDGAYATDIVPSDPAAPPMSLAGVWVFDDTATPPRLAVIADAAQACGCPAACDAAASPFVAPDDIKDDYFLCDQPPFQSLVGGVIVAAVEDHSDTCHSGLNLYSIEQRDWDLGGAKTTWAPPDVSALDRALAAGSPGAASMCFERGGHGELDIGGGATCLARGTGWIDADETGSDCASAAAASRPRCPTSPTAS